MINVFQIVSVIIGTLIGAGFASGQEIYLFFFSYGIIGIIGILISSIIIGFDICKTFCIIHKYNINNYKEFLNILIQSNEKSKRIINNIINIFILITFFIMIAGFGAYFEQEIGINSLIGSTILAIISYFIFMTSVKGVVKASEFLVPILIIFIIIIGILNLKEMYLFNLNKYIMRTNSSNFAISAILYSCYNSILLIPVLLTLKNYITSKKQIVIITIISIIIILLLSIIMFFIIIRVDVDIKNLEMPAVYVVSNNFKILKYVYGIIILGSIFTTTISLGMSFLQNVAQNKKSYIKIASIMCIASVIISKIGFSKLVSSLYPICGLFGIVQILFLLKIKIN